ncbi:aminoglycoside phosphotransferase family protein [Flindersiella endophytica]
MPFGDALRAELGKPKRVRKLHSSPRSRVWRIELDGTPAIVKQIVDGADPDAQYAREATALRPAARADPPVAPRLLAADESQRVLVLEHLARHRPGPEWVTGYAETLARLHATTGPADAGSLPEWEAPQPADVEAFLRFAGALDAKEDPAVKEELDALLDRLAPAGHFALLHGDPCPGNDLHVDDGVRFVDYEGAALGNGLQELAYLRIGFPTCWTSMELPVAALAEGEEAYRSAWNRETGTDVPGDLADACAGWLIRGDMLVQASQRKKADQLARVLHEDWDWGPPTARERLVHRLGVVAHLAGDDSGLPAFGRLAVAVRTSMLRRWPDLRPLPWARDPRCDLQ